MRVKEKHFLLEQVTFAQGGMSGEMQDAYFQPTLSYQNTAGTAW